MDSRLLASAVALPLALPVWHFSYPTGPYGIGTLSYYFVDSARADIFDASPRAGTIARRELLVQVWYPAADSPSAPRAPYMSNADLVTAAFARSHQSALLFEQFKYVTTHAMPGAPMAGDKPAYPVLIFLEGATGFRQMRTFQVEELVSRGYIVVAIDQPGRSSKRCVSRWSPGSRTDRGAVP